MLTTPRIIGTICMLTLLAATAMPLAAAEPGTTEKAANTTLNVTCNLFRPGCDTAYGNYGTGILRPCSERFWTTWAGGLLTAAAPFYAVAAETGACDRLTVANVTIVAARLADDNVDEPAEPGPAELVARHGLRIACPSSTHGQPAYCETVYGNYGYGPVRPCGSSSGAGACDRNAADTAVDGARTADLLLFP